MHSCKRLLSTNNRNAFDTNQFIKRLDGPLEINTAITLSRLLNEALSGALSDINNSTVGRPIFESEMSAFNIDVAKLKGDLSLRHGNLHQTGKQSMEQLLREMRTQRQKARETLAGIRSEVRLEINLERGKQREAALQTMIKFQDLQTQIDAETGNAYATLAKLRHDIFYSLTGFLFTSIAALFGFLRLTSF